MADEKTPLWERQSWESQASWALFQLYLEQDPPRSITEAYRRYRAGRGQKMGRQVPGSYRNLAAGKKGNGDPIEGAVSFAMRAAAFDDYVGQLEREKWVKRRLDLREKEWETSQRLLEKAQQMLMFPVVAQESADGRTLVLPAGWAMRDIPGFLQVGSKLGRLAAEMSTANVSVDWRAEAQKNGVDPDVLYRELVDRFTRLLGGSDDDGSPGGSEAETSGDPGEALE